MLRVTVEFVEFGIESRAETIGKMSIINDGTGTEDAGNYKVVLDDAPISVVEWPRLDRDAWELIQHILEQRER